MGFIDKLKNKWSKQKFVCVGLDPDISKIQGQSIFEFNKSIIDQTYDLVCAYKPNSAFFEAEGTEGLKALKETIVYIQQKCPDVVIILDAKRADIGNSNKGYVKAIFDN